MTSWILTSWTQVPLVRNAVIALGACTLAGFFAVSLTFVVSTTYAARWPMASTQEPLRTASQVETAKQPSARR